MGGGGSGNRDYSTSIGSPTEVSSSKTKINGFLESLVGDMQIPKETLEKIKNNVEAIISKFKESGIDVEDISWEGSFSKKTYVEGLSDVDLIVSLGAYSESDFEYKDNSKLALKKLKEIICDRYPRTDVKVGNMAVTVTFSDGTELQFLPAFKYYKGYIIPDPKTNGWITTFPKRFKNELTELNKKLNGKLKPTIRLIKNLFNKNGIDLSSYHIENLALKILRDYKGSCAYSAMLLSFLNRAKAEINVKLQDISGQSVYVDDYLGNNGNKQRSEYSMKIKHIEEKLEKYDYGEWVDYFEQ